MSCPNTKVTISNLLCRSDDDLLNANIKEVNKELNSLAGQNQWKFLPFRTLIILTLTLMAYILIQTAVEFYLLIFLDILVISIDLLLVYQLILLQLVI